MSKIEYDLYLETRDEIRMNLSGKPTFTEIIRLRQYCSHPHILDKFLNQSLQESSAKYRQFRSIINEIVLNGEKAIVFTSFVKMLDIMCYDMTSNLGIWSKKIDGSIKNDLRQEIIDEFSNLRTSGILLLNPKAAGAGLNITAANHVIHYNPEWNPAIEDQASARSHRLGQKNTVRIYRLLYIDTLEEIMDERLSKKRELAGELIIGIQDNDNDYLNKILNT